MYDEKYHMADCRYFNIYVKHDKSMTIRKARYHLPESWCLTSTSLPEAGDMLPKPVRQSPSALTISKCENFDPFFFIEI